MGTPSRLPQRGGGAFEGIGAGGVFGGPFDDDAGSLRILFLGDEAIAGPGLAARDRVHEQLARIWPIGKGIPSMQARTAAIPGANMAQIRSAYENHFHKLRPRMIYVFYNLNDAGPPGYPMCSGGAVWHDPVYPCDEAEPPFPTWKEGCRGSFSMWLRSWRQPPAAEQDCAAWGYQMWAPGKVPDCRPAACSMDPVNRQNAQIAAWDNHTKMQGEREKSIEELKYLVDTIRSSGIEPVVVIVPALAQIRDFRVSRQASDAVADAIHGGETQWFDLTPFLEQANQGLRPVFNPDGSTLSASAHELIAKTVLSQYLEVYGPPEYSRRYFIRQPKPVGVPDE